MGLVLGVGPPVTSRELKTSTPQSSPLQAGTTTRRVPSETRRYTDVGGRERRAPVAARDRDAAVGT